MSSSKITDEIIPDSNNLFAANICKDFGLLDILEKNTLEKPFAINVYVEALKNELYG